MEKTYVNMSDKLVGKAIFVEKKLIIPELKVGHTYVVNGYNHKKGLGIKYRNKTIWWFCNDNENKHFFYPLSKKLKLVLKPRNGAKIFSYDQPSNTEYGIIKLDYTCYGPWRKVVWFNSNDTYVTTAMVKVGADGDTYYYE